ncbi:MAG TPA: chemotaxis protein CheW [Spirochaetes bacterium]|nr:chemotaxis protein CheW [Spirochaetota bacterium]
MNRNIPAESQKQDVRDEKVKQLVTFILANEKYGIDIMQTQEIIKIEKMTPIPNALDFVEGVINLRGNVIPIIDLKKRFNLIGGEEQNKGIIVVRLDDMVLGVMIDGVSKVISIPSSHILPPPPVVSGIGREYITGVGKDDQEKLLIILDINKLLSFEEIEMIRETNQ